MSPRQVAVENVGDLDWVVPALWAIDQGQELPPPFDDPKQVWQILSSDPRAPRTTVVSLDTLKG